MNPPPNEKKLMNEILNQNNRTNSEIAFAINRRIDADEAALAASAVAGDKKAMAVLASRAAFAASVSTPERDAAIAADAKASRQSASSIVSSMKAAAAARNLENQIRNAAEKTRKAAVYQQLLVTLAAAKAAKLAAAV
jgi:hypothetical protein